MSRFAPDLAELLGERPTISPVASPAAESLPAAVAAPAGRDVMLGGAYEGADRFDQSLALWAPSLRSADADMLPEKAVLDARARDTVRNDGYVANGSEIHKDTIVGARYMLNATPASAILFGKKDKVWEREAQEELELKFGLWAESDRHWIDRQRTKTFTQMIRLAVGNFLPTGELLETAEWAPNDGRPFRTCVQIVDTDRLSTPWNALHNQRIRGGIERDAGGAPIAYHIRKGHPSDYLSPDSYEWTRVMARKPNWGRQMVLHVFDQVRPDQSRGISALVAGLSEMKMLKGFRRIELQRAVVAATYAASIESELPPAEAFRAMGADDGGVTGEGVANYAAAYLAAIAEYSGGAKGVSIDGVKIPHFFPGTKLRLQNPGNNGPMGDKFEQSALRYLAAILGVSYEQLSKDYSQTNYSSAKAGFGETEKSMSSRKRMVADAAANFKYRLWFEEIVNYNGLECLKRRNVPSFYEGLNAEAYTSCDWIGAGIPEIDPLKEAQANMLNVRAGFDTKANVIRRRGGDWRQIADQQAAEYENDQALKLPSIYDADTTSQQNATSPSDGEARKEKSA